MADEENKPSNPLPSIRVTRSKEFRVAFANTFRFRSSTNDASITFGYQSEVPTPTGAQGVIFDEVEVVLTPLMLKLLHIAMGENVELLERTMGQAIEIPKVISDLWAEQKKAQASVSEGPSQMKEAAN